MMRSAGVSAPIRPALPANGIYTRLSNPRVMDIEEDI